jgi:predicted cupin superfamily sugar epimerase
VHVIEPGGGYSEIQLGDDPDTGEALQAVVKAGRWFASRVRDPRTFALAGCTVAPGFDFADFELGKQAELVRLYPQYRKLIESFTRD